MKYTLKVTDTNKNSRAGKFYYQVIDESGNIVTERRSNREYVACTIDGKFFFGKLGLIGKGDHGKQIKSNGVKKIEPTPIAYKQMQPVKKVEPKIVTKEPEVQVAPPAYKIRPNGKRKLGVLNMDQAKKRAIELSRQSKDSKVYVIVDEVGDCCASFNPAIVGHDPVFCYRNGSEIALDIAMTEKQIQKVVKQIVNPKNEEIELKNESKTKTNKNMKTAAKNVVTAKKPKFPLKKDVNGGKTVGKVKTVKKEKPDVSKVSGKKQTLTAKDIVALIKKGKTVINVETGTKIRLEVISAKKPTLERIVVVED